VIDILSQKEKRGEFAYILNHEAGLYVGRFLGAATFLLLAHFFSMEVALRYAIIIIAVLQLGSIYVAKVIMRERVELMQEMQEEEKDLNKIQQAI
jgi:YQGE family putative transporter